MESRHRIFRATALAIGITTALTPDFDTSK
jgi:hypothetical protein